MCTYRVLYQENELKVEETGKRAAVIAATSELNVEKINLEREVLAATGVKELGRIESAQMWRFATHDSQGVRNDSRKLLPRR